MKRYPCFLTQMQKGLSNPEMEWRGDGEGAGEELFYRVWGYTCS